ncbi:type II toxin-antitoxin system Phd/YefM family antitoxin [Nitrosomonas sp.]|uniref:type II toxin-antitoxin system Phd/YefM family antitoxin n=1 Tax=Nitrosomonas sp. TaxID=42353 RepID=UPI001D1BCDF4|nr:type II toxin-antitoxin system Phd/YefM family antitoxin [Nitrosomonas sp.]MBX3615648.1 type II toxin-antitoxin system Phd/YefM family antitoxin [Nitrosomonas sp.]
MLTVNIHEAKLHLSELIEKVVAGEEIIIVKAGKPVAKLVPLHSAPSARSLGIFQGKLKIPGDFDAALPEEALLQFQNADIEPSSENR